MVAILSRSHLLLLAFVLCTTGVLHFTADAFIMKYNGKVSHRSMQSTSRIERIKKYPYCNSPSGSPVASSLASASSSSSSSRLYYTSDQSKGHSGALSSRRSSDARTLTLQQHLGLRSKGRIFGGRVLLSASSSSDNNDTSNGGASKADNATMAVDVKESRVNTTTVTTVPGSDAGEKALRLLMEVLQQKLEADGSRSTSGSNDDWFDFSSEDKGEEPEDRDGETKADSRRSLSTSSTSGSDSSSNDSSSSSKESPIELVADDEEDIGDAPFSGEIS